MASRPSRLLMASAGFSCIVLTARALAGQVTYADLRFKVFAELHANQWMALILSWFLTSTTTSWAIGERILRKKHIKRVSSEHSQQQQLIDARRRSSHLRGDGTTRPEDEL